MSAWGSGKTLAEQLKEQKREHEMQRQHDREKKAQKMENVDVEISSPATAVEGTKKTHPTSQPSSQPPVPMQPKPKQLVGCVSLPAHWAESISEKYQFCGQTAAAVDISAGAKNNKSQPKPPVVIPQAEFAQARDSGIAVVGSSSLDVTPSSHRVQSHSAINSSMVHEHHHDPHHRPHQNAHHHHEHFLGSNPGHHHHHHHHYYRAHHQQQQQLHHYNQDMMPNTSPHPVGPGGYIAGGGFGSIPMAYHHRQHSPHHNSYFPPMMYEQMPVPPHNAFQRGGGGFYALQHQYPRMDAFVDRPSYTPSHHHHQHHNPNFYPPQ